MRQILAALFALLLTASGVLNGQTAADATFTNQTPQAAAGGGTPGSPDTSIQTNQGSVFTGDADFTWNTTTNVCTIANGQLNVDNLRLDGNTLSSTSGALVLSTASSTLLELAIGGSSKWAIDSSDLRALNFGAYVGVSGDSRVVFANGQLSLYAGAVEALRATTAGVSLVTANGAQWVRGQASELLTLSTSGTTTDTTANLLPANAIIEAVVARVTTTITTATDWRLGDTATAGRFTAPNATMTAGTTDVGLVHIDQTGAAGPRQTAAAKVRVTTTGTPGAGAVRITVFYRQFVAPTS